jgi:hypothetical protein
VVTLASAGCATIFSGTTDTVTVTSDPDGATVTDRATPDTYSTPAAIKMSKRSRHVLTVSMDGYESQIVSLRRDTNVGWWIADALTLGLGNAIDAGTGALFDINPARIHVVLEPVRSTE